MFNLCLLPFCYMLISLSAISLPGPPLDQVLGGVAGNSSLVTSRLQQAPSVPLMLPTLSGRRLGWGAEHTMQQTEDVLWSRTLLLTNVTPDKFSRKGGKHRLKNVCEAARRLGSWSSKTLLVCFHPGLLWFLDAPSSLLVIQVKPHCPG